MKRLVHTLKFTLAFTCLAALAAGGVLYWIEGGLISLPVLYTVITASAIAGTVIAMSRTEDTVIF